MQQLKKPYPFFSKVLSLSLCLGIGLGLSGCLKNQETDLEKQQKSDDQQIKTYLQNKNIQATPLPVEGTNIYYYPLVSNPGGQPVQANNILAVNYSVSSLAGTFIDSLSVPGKGALKLRLLAGALIPRGLDAGLSVMKKGEKYRFFIPSTLAFSGYQNGTTMPANSNLIIDAQIVDVLTDAQENAIEQDSIQSYLVRKNLTNAVRLDSGVYYSQTQVGQGDLPKNFQSVQLKYVGRYLNDTIFDQTTTTPYTLSLSSQNVIPGFIEGVSQMREGEKGTIIIPSSQAYSASLQVIPFKFRQDMENKQVIQNSVLPFSVLVFQVEIVNIQ